MRAQPGLVPFLLFLLLAWLGRTATAQCTPQWQAGDPLPHVRGSVFATQTWDPDGAGPLPQLLVVGGSFAAGSMVSTRIATFDGSQWAPLGTLPGTVTCLCDWNGQLVANCTTVSGNVLSVWNGTAWQQLGIVGGFTYAMTTFQGALVVAGSFSGVGGVTAPGIARWNGTTWSPLGSGTTGTVRAMAIYNSLLYVGGTFTSIGGVAVGNLAAWNGTSWLTTAACNGPVTALAVRNGLALTQYQLFVAGSFTAVGATSAQHIARYTASTATWAAMGTGLPGNSVTALTVVTAGVSSFEARAAVDAPGSAQKVWRWSGTAWVNLASVADNPADSAPSCLTYYGGGFLMALPTAEHNVRRFDGVAAWQPLRGLGLGGRVYAVDANGSDLVVGGQLATISGVTVNHIARGGPGNWQPLGTGIDPAGAVFALARTSNGDVLAGGNFATAGGIPVNHIARWDGTAWSALGTGLNGAVYAIRVLANGDLLATGAFTAAGGTVVNRIARWNGTTWSGLGTGLSAQGNALAVAANGDVIVGGDFLQAGGVTCNRVARWNGTAWSALGAGFDAAVFAVAVLPNGSMAAGGQFQNSATNSCPYVAIWDGTQWARPLTVLFRPNAEVYTLLALPDGDLLAGGATWSFSLSFPPVSIHTTIARLSGSSWSSLAAPGLGTWALAQAPDGTLVAGGEFHLGGSVLSENVARMVTPCPAAATGYGTGCSGTGGANVLTATQLPWLGGTYRGLATGMPPLGFAFVVTGLSPMSVPIAQIAPQGGPGCMALVSFDSVEFALPTAGRVVTQFAIPESAALVGVQIRQQVSPVATDAGGAITAITSTNALLLTIGSF